VKQDFASKGKDVSQNRVENGLDDRWIRLIYEFTYDVNSTAPVRLPSIERTSPDDDGTAGVAAGSENHIRAIHGQAIAESLSHPIWKDPIDLGADCASTAKQEISVLARLRALTEHDRQSRSNWLG
jgi:hypothetical protein